MNVIHIVACAVGLSLVSYVVFIHCSQIFAIYHLPYLDTVAEYNNIWVDSAFLCLYSLAKQLRRHYRKIIFILKYIFMPSIKISTQKSTLSSYILPNTECSIFEIRWLSHLTGRATTKHSMFDPILNSLTIKFHLVNRSNI